MPKKRPFFEYKGLPGLMESIDKMAGNRPDPTFRSDDIPYMNEGDGYGRSRHHHHHRSRSRSRSRSKSRSRSQTHGHSRSRSHHHHHHYHHHHHNRDRRRRDRDRDRDLNRTSERQLQQQAQGQQRPSTKPPVAFAVDDRNNSLNPSPEQTFPHRTVQDQAVHAQKVAEAERAAQASAAATALAAGVGAAAVTGMAMNNQPQQYPQPQQQQYLPENINNFPPDRPPSDIHLSQAEEDEGPGMYGQQQQNPVPYRPNSVINVPIEDGRQKSLPHRMIDGIKDFLPRRFQQKDNVGLMQIYGDRMSESQGGMTLGGITQAFRTNPPGTINPSGMTPSQTGMIHGGGGGPMSEFTHHSRTSDAKSKDEIAKDKRNRQMKRAGKVALGVLGLGVASALFRSWIKSRNRKNEPETDAGDDSDDDDDGDSDSRIHGGGGGGGQKGDSYGGRVNPLRMKPPETLFSAKAPQGETLIIERSGKFHREVSGGTTLLIPWMDRVAFRHTKREFGFPLRPTECFTRDSVGVDVTALMFLKVEDAVAASYEVQNLSHSLQLMGLSCMKKEIVSVTLTHFFSKRDALTERIVRAMNAAIRPWGLRCTRFEFEHLDLPPDIRDSMEREARADRLRHADILHSEGQRQALINKADAEMQAQMRMSQARQMDIVNQAIGEAHAIQERGEAIANAMRDVAEVVNEPGGEQALRLRIAEQYINAYAATNQARNNGGRVNGSEDMVSPNYGQHQPGVNNLPHGPAQVVQHMDHAIGLLSTLGDPNAANPYGVPPPHPAQAHPQSQSQPQQFNPRRRQRPVGRGSGAAAPMAAAAGLRPPPVRHQHDEHVGSPAHHHHHDMAAYSSPPSNMPVHPQHAAAAGDAYINDDTIVVDGDEDDENDDLYEPAAGPISDGYNNNRYGQGESQWQQQESGVRIIKHNEYLDDDDDDDDERMPSPPKRHGYYAAPSPSA